MSTVQQEPTQLRRRCMSWEHYLALPEGVRAEYVDGEVVIAPPPTRGHNRAALRLSDILRSSLDAGLDVALEAGWQLGTLVRIPDVAVWAAFEDVSITQVTPILVVEVLSPSTRTEDTGRKLGEYAAAGVLHYWVLDHRLAELVIRVNTGTGWEVVLRLDDQHPAGEVTVGEHGTVTIDLAALLAP